jgi:hypothetical protein
LECRQPPGTALRPPLERRQRLWHSRATQPANNRRRRSEPMPLVESGGCRIKATSKRPNSERRKAFWSAAPQAPLYDRLRTTNVSLILAGTAASQQPPSSLRADPLVESGSLSNQKRGVSGWRLRNRRRSSGGVRRPAGSRFSSPHLGMSADVFRHSPGRRSEPTTAAVAPSRSCSSKAPEVAALQSAVPTANHGGCRIESDEQAAKFGMAAAFCKVQGQAALQRLGVDANVSGTRGTAASQQPRRRSEPCRSSKAAAVESKATSNGQIRRDAKLLGVRQGPQAPLAPLERRQVASPGTPPRASRQPPPSLRADPLIESGACRIKSDEQAARFWNDAKLLRVECGATGATAHRLQRRRSPGTRGHRIRATNRRRRSKPIRSFEAAPEVAALQRAIPAREAAGGSAKSKAAKFGIARSYLRCRRAAGDHLAALGVSANVSHSRAPTANRRRRSEPIPLIKAAPEVAALKAAVPTANHCGRRNKSVEAVRG